MTYWFNFFHFLLDAACPVFYSKCCHLAQEEVVSLSGDEGEYRAVTSLEELVILTLRLFVR